jgi:hypothetical protein
MPEAFTPELVAQFKEAFTVFDKVKEFLCGDT